MEINHAALTFLRPVLEICRRLQSFCAICLTLFNSLLFIHILFFKRQAYVIEFELICTRETIRRRLFGT